MGRFDLINMDDDERDALAEKPVDLGPAHRALRADVTDQTPAERARVNGDRRVALGGALGGASHLGRRPATILNTRPQDYVFAVLQNEHEIFAAFTPVGFWRRSHRASDWHLGIESMLPDYLAAEHAVMEGTFVVEQDPDNIVPFERVLQDLTNLDFVVDPEFRRYMQLLRAVEDD